MSVVAREFIDQIRHIFKTINSTNRLNKIVFTVSIGAIGISIAINYYKRLLSIRKKRIMNKTTLYEMIPELKNPNVKIKNPVYVELILSNLIHGGKDHLQVVSDFDRTISLCHFDGAPSPTSNGVLENSKYVTPEIRQKFKELREYYFPIEHSPKMSKEEKLPHMIDWWTKSLDLTVQTQISRDHIIEIVKNSSTHLKDGCKWFFYTLERYDVPLLVFSAGLGDMIQQWIVQELGIFKNLKIVSNFMSFDKETNIINGFQGSLIHIFNKNESVLLDTEYEKLIKNRSNVLLLGDSLGDVDMANGFPTLKNLLKIGFLNEHPEELLSKYMDAYDIVTVKDQTFNVPNAILRSII